MPEYIPFQDRSLFDRIGSIAKGGALLPKYFGSEPYLRHHFNQDKYVADLAKRFPGPRISGGLLDSAINYAGAYDWSARPEVDPQDARDMALAYQMYDSMFRDFGGRVPAEEELDYIQNMVGVEAGIKDREKGYRMPYNDLLDAAARYAEEYVKSKK